jgi:hypothetical protein
VYESDVVVVSGEPFFHTWYPATPTPPTLSVEALHVRPIDVAESAVATKSPGIVGAVLSLRGLRMPGTFGTTRTPR